MPNILQEILLVYRIIESMADFVHADIILQEVLKYQYIASHEKNINQKVRIGKLFRFHMFSYSTGKMLQLM